MTAEIYQAAAAKKLQAEALPILREFNIARDIFKVESLNPEDNTYEWPKPVEDVQTQYNFEIVTPRYSSFGTTLTTKQIGIIQEDVVYTRHDNKRITRDVLNMDARKRYHIENLREREEQVAIYGESGVGFRSFDHEGTLSTDMTVNIDTGTFAECVVTLETMITEARTDLKGREFKKATKHVLCTPNVMARFTGIFSTVSDEINIYIWLAKRLAQLNGVRTSGEEFLHESGYLGSASGEGSANLAFICSHPDNMVLASGPLEALVAKHEINGVQIQYALRTAPVFKNILATHYDAAVTMT